MKNFNQSFQKFDVIEEENVVDIEFIEDSGPVCSQIAFSCLYLEDLNLIIIPSIYSTIFVINSKTWKRIKEIEGKIIQFGICRIDDHFFVASANITKYSFNSYHRVSESMDHEIGRIFELVVLRPEKIILCLGRTGITIYDPEEELIRKRFLMGNLPKNPFASLSKSKKFPNSFYCPFWNEKASIGLIDYEKEIIKKEFSSHTEIIDGKSVGIFQVSSFLNYENDEILVVLGNKKFLPVTKNIMW